MGVYAYLRGSTDEQDVDNQRHEILEYANTHNLGSLQFVEDSASGKTNWETERSVNCSPKPCQKAMWYCSLRCPEWRVLCSRFWRY